jgi:hypothetical protein
MWPIRVPLHPKGRMGFFFYNTMAIVTTVSIMDERGDKIQVVVNNYNKILIVEAFERPKGFKPITVLTPTDARALARLILDAAGLAEEEQEKNRKNGYPLA